MIKMIIKMDNDKINASPEYSTDRVYSALDRIFFQRGMERFDTDQGIEYRGHENPTDFAYFGKILVGLKDQPWFINNASRWLLCNSDDVNDPEDFSEEDLLARFRSFT